MNLSIVDEDGTRFVEGVPDVPLLSRAADAASLVEACGNAAADAVLLYAPNLTARFFDLSSGEAGAVLQTLQNYRVRLAVVCPPGSITFSRRFGEMVEELRRGTDFGIFDTRREAVDWLKRPGRRREGAAGEEMECR